MPKNFVNVPKLGIGQLLENSDGIATVQFLETPGAPTIVIETAEFTPINLQNETRIWVEPMGPNGRWLNGRIGAEVNEDGTYWVKLPNDETLRIDSDFIWIRWHYRPANPLVMLANRICETPHKYMRRLPAVQELTMQASLIAGLKGLWTSGVELHDHQIEAARKILMDSEQRYLLADEVGLGKTIEAGLVLRQILSQEPHTKVLIIVPDHLISQWANELETKFRINEYGNSQVLIAGHSEIMTINGDFNMCIVDEVHRLARHPDNANDQEKSVFEALRSLCHKSPRVLLLSATPVRANALDYLAILYLLSPDNHPLSEVAEFNKKLEIRNNLGEVLLGFDATTPTFLIQYSIDEFRNLISDDSILETMLADLQAKALHEDDCSEIIGSIRTYLANKYRIHRRLIRNRRVGRLSLEFPVRGRNLARVVNFESRSMTRWEYLDDVRAKLSTHNETSRQSSLSVFKSVLHLLCYGDWESVKTARDAAVQLGDSLKHLLESSVENDQVADMRVLTIRNYFYNLRTLGGGTDQRKKAIFVTSPYLASKLEAACLATWGKNRTFRIEADDESTVISSKISAYRNTDGQAFLICDESVEEGINLQFIDLVMFADLPWSSSHIEQRIGRFDRFSEKFDAIEILILKDDRSVESDWVNYLSKCGIFNQSVAGLQYALSDFEEKMLSDWLDNGIEALATASEGIAVFVEGELRELKKQDAIDANEGFDSEFNPFFASLKRANRRSAQLQKAVLDWASELGFKIFELSDNRIRITTSAGKTLLINEATLSRLQPEFWQKPGSFLREIALEHPGDRIFGVGDRVIDALFDFTLSDDRGRIAARRVSTRKLLPEISIQVFDFHYRVDISFEEINVEMSLSSSQIASLKHEVQQLFPVIFISKYLTEDGNEISPMIQDLVDAPYKKGVDDVNLGGSAYAEFKSLTSSIEWSDRCVRLEDAARSIIESDGIINDGVESSLRRTHELQASRMRIIESRVKALVEDQTQIDVQKRLDSLILKAIANPLLTLDCCRVTFLLGKK